MFAGYNKVTTIDQDLNRAFTIDEEEEDAALSMEELEARHANLLAEASSTLEATAGSVAWLQEERNQQVENIRAITGGPAVTVGAITAVPENQRGGRSSKGFISSCCPCRPASCTIS